MIKASEAKANVEKYVQTTIEDSLRELNIKIIEASEKGETCIQRPYTDKTPPARD